MPEDRIEEIIAPEELLPEESQRRYDDAWTWMLSHRMGRVILKDLLEITNFGVSAFGGNVDMTLLNAGKQTIGEHVMGNVNRLSPEGYFLMIKESKEDEEYDRSERTKRANSSDNTSSGTDDTDDTSG